MRELGTPPRLIEQVYQEIVEEICDGRLAPNERFTQDSLAERLNVSRQPVGQAIALLKAHGLVCEAGRRGLKISPLEPIYVGELYEMRAALDELAARLAARRAASDISAHAKPIIEAGLRALKKGELAGLIAADTAFHKLIYELSGNHVLAKTMALHWTHIRRIMRGILSIEGYPDEVWGEHRAILRAIELGDAKRAAHLARAHVVVSAELLLRQLKEAGEPGVARKRVVSAKVAVRKV
jgi:DNA-binding GntR family transcriptional regulator